MAPNTPRDQYYGVWLIFFMLGLGTLLPWNFFMTATVYFTGRLRDTSADELSANGTDGAEDRRSALEATFNNVMTLCAMLPLLLFTCLNSLLHSLVSQRLRVMGSLSAIMLVFVLTAVLVKVPLEPLPFFAVTMVKIVIINSFGAVLQGSLFGMAGVLPASYTTPIMSGQGMAGTFAAFSMICAIASGSEIHDAAFGYFITACAVIMLSILSYTLLPKLEFFQFYQDKKTEEGNSLSLMNRESNDGADTRASEQKISMVAIFKKIWLLALCVCLTFTITIGVFPAITADIRPTLTDGTAWEKYFVPVSCFLLFNLSDWGGRSLTAVYMQPRSDSLLLPLLIMARLAFIPLFMLCNIQPRSNLPVFFHHDAWFIAFMLLFAFSNGYLASLCMCFGPKNVLPHEAETAGAIMAFFLSLGLALGAGLSFIFRALV